MTKENRDAQIRSPPTGFSLGGAGIDAVYWGFLLLLGGLLVYIWIARS